MLIAWEKTKIRSAIAVMDRNRIMATPGSIICSSTQGEQDMMGTQGGLRVYVLDLKHDAPFYQDWCFTIDSGKLDGLSLAVADHREV